MKTVRITMLIFTVVSVVAAIVSMLGLAGFGPFNTFFYLGSALFFFWLYLNPALAYLNVKAELPRITATKSWVLAPAAIVIAILGCAFA